MNLQFNPFPSSKKFILTDFNCATLEERLDKGLYYKIIWSRDAAITITIDGYRQELLPNQVLFCSPFNKVQIDPFTKGVVSFVFNKAFYCISTNDAQVPCNGLLFFGVATNPKITLDAKQVKQWENILFLMQEEFEITDVVQEEMLVVLLKRILLLSTRMVSQTHIASEASNKHMDLIRHYHILVEKHFREAHMVGYYAKVLGKSPKTLSNIFKKIYTKTPIQIIKERIVLEAERLLLYSDKTVQDISQELGFEEVSHFSHFFKKAQQISPLLFRKAKNRE